MISLGRTLAASLCLSLSSSLPITGARPFGYNQLLDIGLENGDLIFRDGIGWRSDVVRLSSGEDWSHVGIISLRQNDLPTVIHAAPKNNGSGRVEQTPLDEFIDQSVASKVAVYRNGNLNEQSKKQIVKIAVQYADDQIPFDHEFDINDRSKLYCTELVIDTFEHAGVPLTHRFTKFSTVLTTYQIAFPTDLLGHETLERIM